MSKIKYMEENERYSKYFFSRLNSRKAGTYNSTLRDENNNIIKEEQIPSYVEKTHKIYSDFHLLIKRIGIFFKFYRVLLGVKTFWNFNKKLFEPYYLF